jgi:hypothetical protein
VLLHLLQSGGASHAAQQKLEGRVLSPSLQQQAAHNAHQQQQQQQQQQAAAIAAQQQAAVQQAVAAQQQQQQGFDGSGQAAAQLASLQLPPGQQYDAMSRASSHLSHASSMASQAQPPYGGLQPSLPHTSSAMPAPSHFDNSGAKGLTPQQLLSVQQQAVAVNAAMQQQQQQQQQQQGQPQMPASQQAQQQAAAQQQQQQQAAVQQAAVQQAAAAAQQAQQQQQAAQHAAVHHQQQQQQTAVAAVAAVTAHQQALQQQQVQQAVAQQAAQQQQQQQQAAATAAGQPAPPDILSPSHAQQAAAQQAAQQAMVEAAFDARGGMFAGAPGMAGASALQQQGFDALNGGTGFDATFAARQRGLAKFPVQAVKPPELADFVPVRPCDAFTHSHPPMASSAQLVHPQSVCHAHLHVLYGSACCDASLQAAVFITQQPPGVQVAQYEKVKREAARLAAEVERLDKEVIRQKTLRCAQQSTVVRHGLAKSSCIPCAAWPKLAASTMVVRHAYSSPDVYGCSGFAETRGFVKRRETERNEFAEAKDRLKHSWAADRDDFARVKDALKKKNADHHVQNGRLSQALKV